MVPVATPAAMMVTKSMPRPLASHQPDAVAEHDLAGDEREEDDALDHARNPGRLDLAAGQDERAEEDRGDDDPERGEARDVGHDDRREAVARRDRLLQALHDAAHLGHAGQAGQAAGDHEDGDRVARDVDARVARRRRTVAREADLVAPATAPEDEPDGDRGGQREGEAEMDGQAAEGWDLWGQVGQPRQPGLPGELRRGVEPSLLPWPEDPEGEPERRDVVEHQR